MAYETLRYEAKDGIATITLNRPDAYNALNLALGRDLEEERKGLSLFEEQIDPVC